MSAFPITHKVDVYHLTVTADKEGYEASPSITDLNATILPAGTEILAVYPGESSFQLYEIYVYEDVTIKNGDKVKCGTDEWIVKGAPQVFDLADVYYQKMVGEKVVGT